MALSNPYAHSAGLKRPGAAPYVPANTGYGLLNPGTTLPVPGTAPPAPPSGTPSPAGVDYKSLLQNDPILGQSNANTAAQTIANQASLTAARRAALASYGAVPENLGNVSDIDATTRQLAGQATAGGVSTVARLRHAYDQVQQGDVASLAARGMLRSGGLGQHLSEDLSNFNVGSYDAQQKLLDYLNGLAQGFQQQQQQLQQQGLGAQNDALLRVIEEIKAGLIGGGGGTSSPAPVVQSALASAPVAQPASAPYLPAAAFSRLNRAAA